MHRLTVTMIGISVMALSPLGAYAAECTDAEVAHDDDLWAWPPRNPPARLLAGMAASMADCTYNGVSNKIEVQNAITVCTGGDTTGPRSPSTNAPSTAAPSPATTASNTACVTSEVNNMVNLYTAAASSDECTDDSSVSATSIVITTFCGSACASKLEELATSLPNCYYGYQSENLKADLLEQLDGCNEADTSYTLNVNVNPEETTEAPSTTSPPTTTSPPNSTTTPTATPLPDVNSTSMPTPGPTQRDSGTHC